MDDCKLQCPPTSKQPKESDVVPMILAAVLGAALLVVLVVIVVKHRHKLRQILSAVNTNGPLPATDLSGSSQLDKPLIDSSKTPFKLDSLPGNTVCVVEDPVLQQQNAAQNVTLPLPDITLQTQATFLNSPEILYKVIECIPVGRWTELIRRLGVSNHVIDTSEHDYRPYKEAQYAMLSHWVHNAGSSGAARDMLFRVLREMNLGGCIEKIEESL
ncbi:Tumor necrosis factor receptor superfamily member [Pristimantis euphronides]